MEGRTRRRRRRRRRRGGGGQNKMASSSAFSFDHDFSFAAFVVFFCGLFIRPGGAVHLSISTWNSSAIPEQLAFTTGPIAPRTRQNWKYSLSSCFYLIGKWPVGIIWGLVKDSWESSWKWWRKLAILMEIGAWGIERLASDSFSIISQDFEFVQDVRIQNLVDGFSSFPFSFLFLFLPFFFVLVLFARVPSDCGKKHFWILAEGKWIWESVTGGLFFFLSTGVAATSLLQTGHFLGNFTKHCRTWGTGTRCICVKTKGFEVIEKQFRRINARFHGPTHE